MMIKCDDHNTYDDHPHNRKISAKLALLGGGHSNVNLITEHPSPLTLLSPSLWTISSAYYTLVITTITHSSLHPVGRTAAHCLTLETLRTNIYNHRRSSPKFHHRWYRWTNIYNQCRQTNFLNFTIVAKTEMFPQYSRQLIIVVYAGHNYNLDSVIWPEAYWPYRSLWLSSSKCNAASTAAPDPCNI